MYFLTDSIGIEDFRAFLILALSEEQLIIPITKRREDKIRINRFIIAEFNQDIFFT